MTEMVMHDQLTGLANREALTAELGRALSSSQRSGRATAVLMIGLDRFSEVNESLGHHFGDEMLRAAAARLEVTVRGSDVVGRNASDEFLVVIGNCTHLGCLPKARFEQAQPELGADWPGGFFCPCHGSRFDLAGRVFQGSPASVNLRIPPYSFSSDSQLVIGKDDTAQGAA